MLIQDEMCKCDTVELTLLSLTC